ncbi:24186_t:CDS:2 [Gigaspora rosea]|nr:24186_t:CDS:2 [Gigaspora rosea]
MSEKDYTKLLIEDKSINHQDHKYYFLDLIRTLEQELKNVPLKDYKIWHDTNKVQVDVGSIIKEVKECIKEDSDYISSIKADRHKAIEEKFDDMYQKVDENAIKFNCEVLNQCNSFKNSVNLLRPFNKKC